MPKCWRNIPPIQPVTPKCWRNILPIQPVMPKCWRNILPAEALVTHSPGLLFHPSPSLRVSRFAGLPIWQKILPRGGHRAASCSRHSKWREQLHRRERGRLEPRQGIIKKYQTGPYLRRNFSQKPQNLAATRNKEPQSHLHTPPAKTPFPIRGGRHQNTRRFDDPVHPNLDPGRPFRFHRCIHQNLLFL